jgi:hypothetical protein
MLALHASYHDYQTVITSIADRGQSTRYLCITPLIRAPREFALRKSRPHSDWSLNEYAL